MPKYALTIASIMLLLSGCASQQPNENYGGGTLGSLVSSHKVETRKSKLGNTDVTAAMESYRRAANLFKDPRKRKKSIERMAHLAMENATTVGDKAQDNLPTRQGQATEAPSVKQQKLDQKIDKRLHDTYMKGALNAKNKTQRKDMLGMAEKFAGSLDTMNLKGDYQTAIHLYKLLLKNNSGSNKKERADTYYRLARAYAMAGQLDNELKTLTKLTNQYPNSPHYIEAQFRRGEMLFANSEFDTAANAYQIVAKDGPGNFYQQSLYKLGWSHYKLGFYEKSLGDFFNLLNVLSQNQEKLKNEKSIQAKIYQDTTRVISLAFSNLKGPESARQWFAKHSEDGKYEETVYHKLGAVYLHQERYRDAADTYKMFVKVHPQSNAAPSFSTLVIKAYAKGDFPSLVLPAKEAFVKHYGIHSQFWKTHKTQRKDYEPQLKKHLLDIATYYHAQAQKSAKITDYKKALPWYKEYLDTPPVSDQQAEINLRYASVLYSAHEYGKAITQFDYTAYHYDNFDKANKAGYASLLSYQSFMDEMQKQAAKQSGKKAEITKKKIHALRKSKITAGLKFAKHFNDDKHVPAVLKNVTNDQLAINEVEGAVKTAGFLVNHKPTPDNSYLLFGWETIANGEYDLKRYKVAEAAYKKLLALPGLSSDEQTHYRNRLAMTVYQEAADLERAGKDEAAAEGFLRVAKVYPQADIRKKADFTAASLFLKSKNYKRSITVLTAFQSRFPDDKLTKTIPAKLAVAYEKTGDYTNAAAQLEIISDREADKKPEMARQALWKAAKMQDRAKRPDISARLYEKYARLYPTPYNFQAEAHYRLLQIYKKTNQPDKQHQQLEALVATWKAAGDKADSRVTWLAAYAGFHLAEPLYDTFNSIKLTLPLKKSLAEKSAAMKKALKAYTFVVDMKVADFTPAANYRIASLYQTLSDDILHSERPKGMSKLEGMQYDMLLQNQALPYSDKAIDIYKVTANLAHQDIYNKWVKKSFAALAKLVPGRYAKFEQVEDYVDIIY